MRELRRSTSAEPTDTLTAVSAESLVPSAARVSSTSGPKPTSRPARQCLHVQEEGRGRGVAAPGGREPAADVPVCGGGGAIGVGGHGYGRPAASADGVQGGGAGARGPASLGGSCADPMCWSSMARSSLCPGTTLVHSGRRAAVCHVGRRSANPPRSRAPVLHCHRAAFCPLSAVCYTAPPWPPRCEARVSGLLSSRVDPRGGHLVSLRAQSERMTTCVNWSPSLARSASVATIIRTRTRRTTRTASSSRSTVAGAGRTLCTRRRARRSPLCP